MSAYDREIFALHLITDTALCLHHRLLDVVQASVHGGVSCVQLREKTLPTREFVALAGALKKLLAAIPRQVPLIINDRVDVGQEDMPVDIIRRWLPDAIVGLSVSSIADIKSVEAHQLDIDYLGVGPVFSTPTKLDATDPIGLDGLARVRSITRLPLVAIGGINSQNAAEVLAAGADGLAVVSAICAARDPEESARRLSAAFQTTVPHKFR